MFSIHIASFNNLNNLKELLSDLDKQSMKCFEVLVSVGLSNDGTKEFLVCHKSDYKIKVIDGKDEGVYDALNKTIAFMDSRYAICFGADERIINNLYFSNLYSFINSSSTSIYYTNLFLGNIKTYRKKIYPDPTTFKKRYGGLAHLHHQTAIIPVEFLKSYSYNTQFVTHADLDLMLAAQKKYDLYHIPECGVIFSEKGISSKKSDIFKNLYESMKIRKIHKINPLNIWCILSSLRLLFK